MINIMVNKFFSWRLYLLQDLAVDTSYMLWNHIFYTLMHYTCMSVERIQCSISLPNNNVMGLNSSGLNMNLFDFCFISALAQSGKISSCERKQHYTVYVEQSGHSILKEYLIAWKCVHFCYVLYVCVWYWI